MSESHDLTKLEPNSFEHLVNHLALCVLGAGHTGFCPGADGGRDGFFEGMAPYPSEVDNWAGKWYIQSKFHKPHLSKDPQKWLLQKIKEEIKVFNDPENDREWPDNFIVATNIEPSGVLMTGAFDQARDLISEACPKLKDNFHIWGGSKIIQLLALFPKVGDYYRHFLTPGNVLTSIFDHVKDAHAEIKTIIRYLIVRQFNEQIYTKLDQAGSEMDTRPGIHKLFIDLPFKSAKHNLDGFTVQSLVRASGRCQRIDNNQFDSKEWNAWHRHPSRARVWFVKGGPGQGKSTIGQYFCQIQRAALILQKNSIDVLSRDRRIAKEIQRIAEQDDFWPIEPRIPISIELKDFAQWFGQRNKLKDPRGILTYLAECISAGVEQPVLAGTLKRALGSRSWFVLFDGLDEVPNDVKDGVAGEVLNFIDNICLECKSDLLALCTSRPQGYAGHFSKLDAPIIELVDLSPTQALRCAEPVLTFERTEDEVSKTLSILKSAIESVSVRELMTTPLQAHIMAVVVRDGGRPPDRRWQLFNNFYQVIKRREANRDLPDKNLAKLLREDDQLLKTVHNRLGFILQASAENSKGAQTHLAREEFKKLVTSAVSQMIEQDIEKTVDILMEATTDRLVLVSTPDDGNHLRFDIRPLQEFFAAEFIYDSINAEALQQRLELIAGDAHWREVMHFLLSAFIENNRRTELSVVIGALEALNEGEDGDHIRLLKRRMGRGSFLAVRLLQEGVLEQDKRLRQQFRKCLEPLTSSTDLVTLMPLISVCQTNSKSWLLNFLFDIINEADKNESIGAAIVLTFILPDTDNRLEDLKDFFLKAPAEYNSIILEAIPRNHFGRDDNPTQQKWYLGIILKLLLRSDFFHISKSAINSALSILGREKEKTLKIAIKNNFTLGQQQALNELLVSGNNYGLVSNKNNQTLDCGIVLSSHFTHDWTTGTYEYKYIKQDIVKNQSDYTGILKLIFKIVRFNKNRTFDNFISLISLLRSYDSNLLEVLPGNLAAYIPVNRKFDTKHQINELFSINEEQYDILFSEYCINNRYVHRPTDGLMLGTECDMNQWEKFISIFPELAFLLISESFWKGFPNREEAPIILSDKKAIELLIDEGIKNPIILLYNPSVWGYILKFATTKKDELRIAMREAASSSTKPKLYFTDDFYPFKLILPEDAAMLPHVLSACTGSQFRKKNITKLSLKTKKMVEDKCLKEILSNPQFDSNIRAASVFFLILNNPDQKMFKKNKSKIMQLYYPGIGDWFFRAITFCIRVILPVEGPMSQKFIGDLLYTIRKDVRGKKEIDTIISEWRETSHSPIQSTKVLQKWLNES